MRASEKYKSPYGKAPRKVEDVASINRKQPKFEWDEPHYKEHAKVVLSRQELERLIDGIQYLRRTYEQGRASLAEVNQGFRSLFHAVIRGKSELSYSSGPEYRNITISPEDLDLLFPSQEPSPQQIKRPSYTKTILPPPPEFYCIQYIGGVFNSEQQFLKVSAYPGIAQGTLYHKSVPQEIDLTKLQINQTSAEIQTYKLTFIPQSETPFSDAQIVIALFQP